MMPLIDHLHVIVEDLRRAEEFYDALAPLLGFDISRKEYDEVPEHDYRLVEYHSATMSLGLVSQRTALNSGKASKTRAGAVHHIAFRAASADEVDVLHDSIKALGAEIVHSPRFYPEYCADYYAFFFKDCEGIEYEIVSFNRAILKAPPARLNGTA